MSTSKVSEEEKELIESTKCWITLAQFASDADNRGDVLKLATNARINLTHLILKLEGKMEAGIEVTPR